MHYGTQSQKIRWNLKLMVSSSEVLTQIPYQFSRVYVWTICTKPFGGFRSAIRSLPVAQKYIPQSPTSMSMRNQTAWSSKNWGATCFLPTWVKCSAKICMYRKTIYPLTCPNCSWTKNITVTMSRASHPGDKSTESTGWQHPPDLLLVDGCHTFLAQLRDNLVRLKSQMWPDWKLLSQHILASQIHMHIESFNQVH